MTSVTTLSRAPGGGKQSSAPVVEFDRPADIDAYAAGDVISDADGTAKVLEFTGCGRSGQINHAMVAMEETDTVNLELLLFDTEPTNFADNALLALTEDDLAKVIAAYSFASSSAKAVNAGGEKVYLMTLDAEGTNAQSYTTLKGSLFGLLVTRSVFTPVASSRYAIRIHVKAD